jgi:TolB protein
MRHFIFVWAACVLVGAAAGAAPLITVIKQGADKNSVSLAGLTASGANGRLFVQTLERDLEISGYFKVGPTGAVRVQGQAAEAGMGVQTRCAVTWPGKKFDWAKVSAGQAEVRKQAHQLADEMVRLIAGETGFAQSKIVFVNRRGRNNADVYMCDADGMGVRQITRDNVAAVGPRWAPNGSDIYYTSFMRGYPSIYRMNISTGDRKALASFRGLNTGAAISPNGGMAALILSYQGNAELYVLQLGTGALLRLTNSPHGAEASPCWSPDGRSIVYVSDVTAHPQLYIVDVATKRSRRITYNGVENVNPDWSKKGLITYATKRGYGYQIATLDPRVGDGSSKLVQGPSDAEHPSWAPDGRHIVCQSGSALFILDTLGDPAIRLFSIPGNWMSPDWSDR